MSDLERMKELVEQLDAAARAYYQESKELMSNKEYDELYDELAALEKKTGGTTKTTSKYWAYASSNQTVP